ncbi:cytochrome C oxidase subunit IV family protein [Adhaeribacter aquaticus]|uniref:cytochrome C oxidase subunit IV family protein n=1 Tax=Adhaeribacter aquaticus TaxID=299567 RepID=UPI00041D0CD1|nr:cytochrome C oxidase subunit IV family protein [Adhaeribacter aquaticus]
MAAHSHHAHDEHNVGEIPPAQTKGIWKVFFILCAITAVEFAFAFMMDAGMLRNSIFIVLTIVKAFYIVAEFMHLKHETKSLIWTIMIPLVLLVWLIIALISEGAYYGDSVFNYFK